jgi:hypothetical protein
MRRIEWAIGIVCVLFAGCASTPLADNPLPIRPGPDNRENPVLVAPGQTSPAVYSQVFDRVYDVVREYFGVSYSNVYDGKIVGSPTIAPGIEQIWKPGSPSAGERLYATFQLVRYRCFVQIKPAEQGGYMVIVTVLRELKDDPQPQGVLSPAYFRDATTVDRVFNIVDPVVPTDDRWIPKGRETAIEQAILRRVQETKFPGWSDSHSTLPPPAPVKIEEAVPDNPP